MNSQLNLINICDEQQQDCNNRIVYLRSHRFCQKMARECKERCSICCNHCEQALKKDHKRIPIDEFKNTFHQLEDNSNKETQHYIRQINETERNAIEAIIRKKEEYLKEIQQVKIHLMKKTYLSLEEKYPNLYEKYINDRLDTLKCCEVFWVMNAAPNHHSIRHSEINKKFQSILRKFQNFKEISRNQATQNIFTNKEKVKKDKVLQKAKIQDQKEKEPKVPLERIYQNKQMQNRYKQQIHLLCTEVQLKTQQKRNIQKKIKKLLDYHKYLDQLTISKKNNPKLKINSNVIRFLKNFDSPCPIQPQKAKHSEDLSLPPLKTLNENNQQQHIQPTGNLQPSNNKEYKQPLFIVKQIKQISTPAVSENKLLKAIEQNEAEHQPTIKRDKMPQPLHIQQEVKIEPELQPFQSWNNRQLLQKLKLSGKIIDNSIKVEQTYLLQSLSFNRPYQNSFTTKSDPQKSLSTLENLFKNPNTPPRKPTSFNVMANNLFARYDDKKNHQKEKSP